MVSHRSSVFSAIFLLLIAAYQGRAMQAYVDDNNVSSPNTTILGSTYPGTTHDNDVTGLLALVYAFPNLFGVQFPVMSKDPCYPEKLTWIVCTNDAPRRVTALNVGMQSLYGSIPDFSTMDALQTIDFHQNFLFGSIPDFLGTFPKLTYLNLASNYFSGTVPASLSNNKNIKLDISGNPYLSTSSSNSPPSTPIPGGNTSPFPSTGGIDFPDTNGKKKKKSKLPVVLGVTIPPGLLITIGGGVFAIKRHNRNVANAVAMAAIGGT